MAYLGLAGAPSLLSACLAGVVGGIGNGMQWPSLISAVQRLTPEDLHGRMMGAAESLGALCVAIGLPLGGLLVALSSPRAAFIAVGIGALLGGLALLQVRIAGTRPSETAEPGVESTIPPAPIRSPAEQIPQLTRAAAHHTGHTTGDLSTTPRRPLRTTEMSDTVIRRTLLGRGAVVAARDGHRSRAC